MNDDPTTARPADFHVDQRVRHVNRNEIGTVVSVEAKGVRVRFDKPAPRGQRSEGIYDDLWFQVYPGGLVPEDSRNNAE